MAETSTAPLLGALGRWEGIIPDVVPSDNAQRRWHWSKLKREQRDWFWQLRAALHHVPKAEGFRRVTITRFAHGLFDVGDNLGGAHKSLVRDLLRPMKHESGVIKSGAKKGQLFTKEHLGLGLIIGDGPKQAEFVYAQALIPRKSHPYTTILIEEVSHGRSSEADQCIG